MTVLAESMALRGLTFDAVQMSFRGLVPTSAVAVDIPQICFWYTMAEMSFPNALSDFHCFDIIDDMATTAGQTKTIRIENRTSAGVLFDPTTEVMKYRVGTGPIITVPAADITDSGTGLRDVAIATSLGQDGFRFHWRWEITDSGGDTGSQEGTFDVDPSVFS